MSLIVGAVAGLALATVLDAVATRPGRGRPGVGVLVGLGDQLTLRQVKVPPMLASLSDHLADVLRGGLGYNSLDHNFKSPYVVRSPASVSQALAGLSFARTGWS